MKRFKYLAVAAIVALGACDEGGDLTPSEDITGSLTVTVSAEGDPVDVTVQVAGPESRSEATGADGTVTFADLEAGAYTVSITGIPSDFAFANNVQTTTVDEDGATVNFSGSVVRSASIAGQVTADGSGVAGVTIGIEGPEGSQSAQTGSNGNYSFTGLRGGSYDITMTAITTDQADCAEATVTRQLPAGGSAVADFGCAAVGAGDATISIQSITTGGMPVNVDSVAGQIEITLNIDRAGNELDRAEVLIGGEVVASQSFAPAAIAGGEAGQVETLVLNVPTTQLRMGANGWVPVVFNGGRTISANLFVVGETQPVPSNEVPVVMNNPDAILVGDATVEADDDADSADDAGGDTWFNGSANAGPYTYLSYAGADFEPTHVAFADVNAVCGAATSNLTGDADDGLIVTNTYTCANAEGAVAPDFFGAITVTLPTTVGPDGSTVVPPTGISRLGAQFMLDGEDRRFLIGNAGGITNPTALNIDNLGPTISIDGEDGDPVPGGTMDPDGVVAFHDLFDEWWINGVYDFRDTPSGDDDIEISDGGVGLASPDDGTEIYLFVPGEDCGDVAAGSVLIESASDLDETFTSDGTPEGHQLCAIGSDLLDNSTPTGPSNFFGVDIDPMDGTELQVRLHGTTAATPLIAGTPPNTTDDAVSETEPFTIFNIADTWDAADGAGPDATAGTAHSWGLEAIDDRAGFHQGAEVAGFPASQSLVQTLSTGETACSGIATTANDMPTQLSDMWVRTETEVDFVCGFDATFDGGVWRYLGFVTDRAGNQSQEVEFIWGIDQDAGATVSSVGFAQTFLTTGEDIEITLFGSDDVELNEAQLALDFPSAANADGNTNLFLTPVPIDTRFDGFNPFDADLWTAFLTGATTTVPGSSVHSRVDFVCFAAGAPYAQCLGDGDVLGDETDPMDDAAAAANYNISGDGTTDVDGDGDTDDADRLATALQGDLVDFGSNPSSGAQTANILPQQWTAGSSTTAVWPTLEIVDAEEVNGNNTWVITTETSRVAPPFTEVFLATADAAGDIWICAPLAAPSVSDNGINRFFTYDGSTVDPVDFPCGAFSTTTHFVGRVGTQLFVSSPIG